MRQMRRLLAAVVFVTASSIATAADHDDAFYGGMPEDVGREEVAINCQACHSLRMVTQQGLNRTRWDHLLDWMVEEQGMAELNDDETTLVLDYLSKYYGPDRAALTAK